MDVKQIGMIVTATAAVTLVGQQIVSRFIISGSKENEQDVVQEKIMDTYGRPFPEPKLVPRTAADCIIIRKGEKCEKEILLITRKKAGPS